MKTTINNKTASIFVSHMTPRKFKNKYPSMKEIIVGKPQKITVAEIKYGRRSSLGIAVCHEKDVFTRKRGTAMAVSRALATHPSFGGHNNKELRRKVYENVFRSEPSPYAQLTQLVKGRPELAKELVRLGKEVSNSKN